jgi:hypothetical protein
MNWFSREEVLIMRNSHCLDFWMPRVSCPARVA